MALNKPALKSALKAALLQQRNLEDNPDSAADTLADAMATAIDAFVKTGQVQPGITVVTAGSATTQTGATTGVGTIL